MWWLTHVISALRWPRQGGSWSPELHKEILSQKKEKKKDKERQRQREVERQKRELK
jgi:hypothetical protein